ncbi:MAG: hypothetical protein RL148_1012 [Planctomycetota bacterium]|jgi:hypothetical protein
MILPVTVSCLILASLLSAQDPQPAAPGAQAQPPLTPMPVPRTVAAHRKDVRIDVDGSLSEWPELPPVDLSDVRQLSGTAVGAWRGPRDLSGAVFLLWDETHLYLAAQVLDEWHRALDPDNVLLTELPVADNLVLTFDPARNTRGLGPEPTRAEDAEFWLAEGTGNELVLWDRLRGTARVVEDGRLAVTHSKEDGRTVYEARIPWQAVLAPGVKAASGLVLDLQAVLNDFDETTDPMPQTRMGWTFGTGPRVDPGVFGSVMLVQDLASLGGVVPEFPAAPAREGRSALDGVLAGVMRTLSSHGPAAHDGTVPPASAGGLERLKALEALDDVCERFPRVDWLEFHQRVHRRMTREVAGLTAEGFLSYCYQVLAQVARAAEAEPPAGGIRLFRLPFGGWLVRSKQANFVVDAAGPDLAHWLWGGMEFCILTQPLDMVRRNDQMILRMHAGKPPRPCLMHIAVHLPVVSMTDLVLVEPGEVYGQDSGIQVKALGHKAPDGGVPWSLGYRIELVGGVRLMVVGPTLATAEVPTEGCDVLVLSLRNPNALEIARAARPRQVVFDDLFLPQVFPAARRLRLTDAHEFQAQVQPVRSWVLAPGESVEVQPGK